MPPFGAGGRKANARGGAGQSGAGQQRRGANGNGKSVQRREEALDGAQDAQDILADEDTELGFGKYLRSPEGIEMMKLFVIANTIVVFMTMAWPQMYQSYELLCAVLFGDDDDDDEDLL